MGEERKPIVSRLLAVTAVIAVIVACVWFFVLPRIGQPPSGTYNSHDNTPAYRVDSISMDTIPAYSIPDSTEVDTTQTVADVRPVPQETSVTPPPAPTETLAPQATDRQVNRLSERQSRVSRLGTDNGHEWMDLGLSVKWATCNVGATQPQGRGTFLSWGETEWKDEYTWQNYRFWIDGRSYDNVKLSKYNNSIVSYGPADGKTVLEPFDDAAAVNWGGQWRMPTKAEFDELKKNCQWTWTSLDGVSGYIITSRKSGYKGYSIFLPATGYRNGRELYDSNSFGYYWTSSVDVSNPQGAWYLYFDSGLRNTSNYYGRDLGRCVRAVHP